MSNSKDIKALAGSISLTDILEKFERTILNKINCAKVGKILKFYEQKADIEITGYPRISGVPVMFLSGNNYSIQIPVEENDDCLVIFCDTDLDNWIEGRGSEPVYSGDMHGISGAIAIVGLKNASTVIPDYATDKIRIDYKGTVLEISENGIYSNKGITSDGDIVAKGNIESTNGDVVASGISLKNHRHQVPGTGLMAPNGAVSGTANSNPPT